MPQVGTGDASAPPPQLASRSNAVTPANLALQQLQAGNFKQAIEITKYISDFCYYKTQNKTQCTLPLNETYTISPHHEARITTDQFQRESLIKIGRAVRPQDRIVTFNEKPSVVMPIFTINRKCDKVSSFFTHLDSKDPARLPRWADDKPRFREVFTSMAQLTRQLSRNVAGLSMFPPNFHDRANRINQELDVHHSSQTQAELRNILRAPTHSSDCFTSDGMHGFKRNIYRPFSTNSQRTSCIGAAHVSNDTLINMENEDPLRLMVVHGFKTSYNNTILPAPLLYPALEGKYDHFTLSKPVQRLRNGRLDYWTQMNFINSGSDFSNSHYDVNLRTSREHMMNPIANCGDIYATKEQDFAAKDYNVCIAYHRALPTLKPTHASSVVEANGARGKVPVYDFNAYLKSKNSNLEGLSTLERVIHMVKNVVDVVCYMDERNYEDLSAKCMEAKTVEDIDKCCREFAVSHRQPFIIRDAVLKEKEHVHFEVAHNLVIQMNMQRILMGQLKNDIDSLVQHVPKEIEEIVVESAEGQGVGKKVSEKVWKFFRRLFAKQDEEDEVKAEEPCENEVLECVEKLRRSSVAQVNNVKYHQTHRAYYKSHITPLVPKIFDRYFNFKKRKQQPEKMPIECAFTQPDDIVNWLYKSTFDKKTDRRREHKFRIAYHKLFGLSFAARKDQEVERSIWSVVGAMVILDPFYDRHARTLRSIFLSSDIFSGLQQMSRLRDEKKPTRQEPFLSKSLLIEGTHLYKVEKTTECFDTEHDCAERSVNAFSKTFQELDVEQQDVFGQDAHKITSYLADQGDYAVFLPEDDYFRCRYVWLTNDQSAFRKVVFMRTGHMCALQVTKVTDKCKELVRESDEAIRGRKNQMFKFYEKQKVRVQRVAAAVNKCVRETPAGADLTRRKVVRVTAEKATKDRVGEKPVNVAFGRATFAAMQGGAIEEISKLLQMNSLYSSESVSSEVSRVSRVGSHAEKAEMHMALSMLTSKKMMSQHAILLYFVKTCAVNRLVGDAEFSHPFLNMMVDADGLVDMIVHAIKKRDGAPRKEIEQFDYKTGKMKKVQEQPPRSNAEKKHDKKNAEQKVAYEITELGLRHTPLFSGNMTKLFDTLKIIMRERLVSWTVGMSETDAEDMQTIHQLLATMVEPIHEIDLKLRLSMLDFSALRRIESFLERLLDDFDMDNTTLSRDVIAELSAYRKKVQVVRGDDCGQRKWELTLSTHRPSKFIEAIFTYFKRSMFKNEPVAAEVAVPQEEISRRTAERLTQNVPAVDPTAEPAHYTDDAEKSTPASSECPPGLQRDVRDKAKDQARPGAAGEGGERPHEMPKTEASDKGMYPMPSELMSGQTTRDNVEFTQQTAGQPYLFKTDMQQRIREDLENQLSLISGKYKSLASSGLEVLAKCKFTEDRPIRVTLYNGVAGGGKSDAVVKTMTSQYHYLVLVSSTANLSEMKEKISRHADHGTLRYEVHCYNHIPMYMKKNSHDDREVVVIADEGLMQPSMHMLLACFVRGAKTLLISSDILQHTVNVDNYPGSRFANAMVQWEEYHHQLANTISWTMMPSVCAWLRAAQIVPGDVRTRSTCTERMMVLPQLTDQKLARLMVALSKKYGRLVDSFQADNPIADNRKFRCVHEGTVDQVKAHLAKVNPRHDKRKPEVYNITGGRAQSIVGAQGTRTKLGVIMSVNPRMPESVYVALTRFREKCFLTHEAFEGVIGATDPMQEITRDVFYHMSMQEVDRLITLYGDIRVGRNAYQEARLSSYEEKNVAEAVGIYRAIEYEKASATLDEAESKRAREIASVIQDIALARNMPYLRSDKSGLPVKEVIVGQNRGRPLKISETPVTDMNDVSRILSKNISPKNNVTTKNIHLFYNNMPLDEVDNMVIREKQRDMKPVDTHLFTLLDHTEGYLQPSNSGRFEISAINARTAPRVPRIDPDEGVVEMLVDRTIDTYFCEGKMRNLGNQWETLIKSANTKTQRKMIDKSTKYKDRKQMLEALADRKPGKSCTKKQQKVVKTGEGVFKFKAGQITIPAVLADQLRQGAGATLACLIIDSIFKPEFDTSLFKDDTVTLGKTIKYGELDFWVLCEDIKMMDGKCNDLLIRVIARLLVRLGMPEELEEEFFNTQVEQSIVSSSCRKRTDTHNTAGHSWTLLKNILCTMICLMLRTDMTAVVAACFKGDDSFVIFRFRPTMFETRFVVYDFTTELAQIGGNNVFEFCRNLTDGMSYITQDLRYRSTKMCCKLFPKAPSNFLQELTEYQSSVEVLFRQAMYEDGRREMITANVNRYEDMSEREAEILCHFVVNFMKMRAQEFAAVIGMKHSARDVNTITNKGFLKSQWHKRRFVNYKQTNFSTEFDTMDERGVTNGLV